MSPARPGPVALACLADLVLGAIPRLGVDDVTPVWVTGDTAADMVAGQRAEAGRVVGLLGEAAGAARLLETGAGKLLDGISGLAGLLGIPDAKGSSGRAPAVDAGSPALRRVTGEGTTPSRPDRVETHLEVR